VAQATLLPRPCEGCGQPLPSDAHRSRKRHPECAYAKALADSRAQTSRLTQERRSAGRAPVKCRDCPAVFQPGPTGAISIRCPGCREEAVRRWKREGYRRSPLAVSPEATRPCRRTGCASHVRRNGKVYPYYCSDGCKPRCSVNPCGDAARRNGLCGSHNSQKKRTGETKPFTYKWSEKRETCLSCNEPFKANGYREFCDSSCRAYWFAHNGDLPQRAYCVHCFAVLPVGKIEGKTRRQRFDILQCRRCRQDLKKYGISVQQLAARDGTNCRLCSEGVDMTLRAPTRSAHPLTIKSPDREGAQTIHPTFT